MSFRNLLFILLVSSTILSCNPSNSFSFTNYTPDRPDFTFLKDALKGKNIVALGESSHGFGDLHRLKGEMAMYMHKELGYDVIMMEGGYGDSKITWENMNFAETGDQIRDNCLPKNLHSEELSPLFNYVKTKSESPDSLIFSGFDSQITGNAFNFKLKHIIDRVEIKIIQDSVYSGLGSYHYMFAAKDSLEAWQFYKNKVLAGVDLALIVIDDNIEEILENKFATEKEIDIINHVLNDVKASVDYDFGEAFTVGIAIRDSLMANNIISQIESEYKDKKVIIWAHNGHIEKASTEDDNVKWMGHFLSEKYGDSYYSLGMFVKKGSIYTHWDRTNRPFDINDPAFIEKTVLNKYGGNVFVNFPDYKGSNEEWYTQKIFGYEAESGGKVTFIPSKRFDGVVLLNETKVPTFIIKSER